MLISLGTTDLSPIAGAHQLGGILFTARILPIRRGHRGTRPFRLGVMVSLILSDEISIYVLEYASGRDHARIDGLYIDQLNAALLALDYDGSEPLIPATRRNRPTGGRTRRLGGRRRGDTPRVPR